MFYGINEVAVIVSAILSMAVGSIWYSPLLFGKQWMVAVGLTEADMESAKARMPKMFALAACANIILLFVLAHVVARVEELGMTVFVASVSVVILMGAALAGNTIWEQRSLSYFLINLTYMAVIIIGGMHVIAYWPW